MKALIRVSLALSIRVLYMLFALMCMYRLRLNSESKCYWFMMASIGLLMIETAGIVWLRMGRDFRGFLPSVLFFICCVLPGIWLLTIDETEQRNQFKQMADGQKEMLKSFVSSSFSLGQLNDTNETHSKAFECCDVNLTYWLREEYLNLHSGVMFQIFLVILTFSRFLTTRVNVYVNQRFMILVWCTLVSLDMIEFFSFVHSEDICESFHLVYAVLTIVSLSLIQFVFLNLDLTESTLFVNSAGFLTQNSDSLMRRNYNFLRNKFKPKPSQVSFVSFKEQKTFENVMSKKSDAACCLGCGPVRRLANQKLKQKRRESNELVFILITSLLLHDVSYLAFRVFICVQYGWYEMLAARNSSLLFLMIKNLTIITVQIYKLYSIRRLKKIKLQNDLLMQSRLEYINQHNNNHFHHKGGRANNNIRLQNPYRFAQIYAGETDETDTIQHVLPRSQNSKSNLKSSTNSSNIGHVGQLHRKKYEYQQQQRVFNPIDEYPLSNVNHFCRSRTDEKSDTETNVSMLDS